ncbi:unnamed protein product [Calypogeia fissa]
MSLPELKLQNLCKLLAREGLSDTAYSRIAEVLKKLAVAAPPHRQLFISELAETARRLGGPALSELESLGDVDTLVISSTSMAGAAMLRVLQALSALTSSSSYKKDSDEVKALRACKTRSIAAPAIEVELMTRVSTSPRLSSSLSAGPPSLRAVSANSEINNCR